MGSLYTSNEPRKGNYKESRGLDIDGDIVGILGSAPDGLNYYDYDLFFKNNENPSKITKNHTTNSGIPIKVSKIGIKNNENI